MENEQPLLVSIHCLVYNHEPYLRQCLDGFVMQQTDFRFEAVVHDDASTDGSVGIIREYAEKYPDIIKPIFETENQYSKKGGILSKIMDDACTGKYVAMCEGDDYWIDPFKLQKQVDFMESHLDYSMCCSDAVIETEDGTECWSRYNCSCRIPPEDMILGGGLFVQTASLLYRNGLTDSYLECCKLCHVGDYPLKIWGVLHDGLYYMAEKMVVYRFQSINSWTSITHTLSLEKQIPGWRSEVDMLQGADAYSHFKYHNAFKKRQTAYVYSKLKEYSNDWKKIAVEFRDVIKMFDWRKMTVHVLMMNHMKWCYTVWSKIMHR